MIEGLKGRGSLAKLGLLLTLLWGIYLIVAWASYSPLDNGWSIASSVAQGVLNRTGAFGAWLIDLLLAMFGKVAFVIPLVMFGVPSYLLAFKRADGITCRQIMGWIASACLLMLGLSGLASVLLSNSAYYLSGGFLGGMWHSVLGSSLFVLLLAMVLTAVGFYFCSGQVLWQLGQGLYGWILHGKAEPVSPTPNDQPDEPDSEATVVETSPSPFPSGQFTDPARFARPNITGLKPSSVVVPPSPSPVASGAMTDVTAFSPKTPLASDSRPPSVEMPVDLPKISVPTPAMTTPPPEVPPAPEVVDTVSPLPSEAAFPKVRLATEAPLEPAIEPVDTVQAADSRLPNVNITPPSFMQPAEPVLAPVEITPVPEEPALPVVHLASPAPAVASVQAVEKVPNLANSATTAVSTETQTKTVSQPTVYPKSYGDSLIHPLLQQQKTVEKPTTPLPTLDLLTEMPPEVQQITEQEIRETSARIEQELANFGVKATVEDVLVGPVVTRYEIRPAAGVKAAKITSLDSDLARALIFQAIRITDVVPGKPFMGIETPNRQRETVWLRDVLASEAFRHSKATLPMALGKNISGDPVVVDMAKMPHLLVAGQTGGGKSVGVNTMILSLLYKLTPEQVRFIMIDPKVVELSIYNDIPHLLTPVVTDMKKAENALRWAVDEMERRYQLVSKLSVRNIEGYNEKIRQAEAMNLPIPNPLWRPGDSMDTLPPPLEKMSYIVLIVDEFADLMMSAGKQVEDHIMRIAQKARAVGIHLILATQRPSTDVITGVIKANIPSRIAFTVASQIDSRTILDKGGAESLLGRGDMLYSGAGSPEIIRVHGAFMTDDDVQRVADNWRARGKPHYIDSIVAAAEDDNVDGSMRNGGELDPLFDEIAQFMIDGGATSISGIQRRFSIGFNRAARIIDQLEEQGILSAPDSRGKRELLAR